MGKETNIAWTDSTVNFWIGCTMVLDENGKLTESGCKECYADEMDKNRFSKTLGGGSKDNPIRHWGKGAPRYKVAGAVRAGLAYNLKPWICDRCGQAFALPQSHGGCDHPDWAKDPVFHRRRIFSLSLGDWLDEEVPIEWLAEMLDTIRQCDQVVWILCTKRPENFKGRMREAWGHEYKEGRLDNAQWIDRWAGITEGIGAEIPKHIILLASVENQAAADKRIPELLKIPAHCHGLSLEPLLARVTLDPAYLCPPQGLRWLIIGGESGSSARPCNVDWIRSLVRQGAAAGVATFVKQLGAKPVIRNDGDDQVWPGATIPFAAEYEPSHQGEIAPLKLRDKKGGDMAEWPVDLRHQEFPKL